MKKNKTKPLLASGEKPAVANQFERASNDARIKQIKHISSWRIVRSVLIGKLCRKEYINSVKCQNKCIS